MTNPAPHFELRRIHEDGSEGEPMLFPLHELSNKLASRGKDVSRVPSDARNSITFDNGSEFAAHQALTAGLGVAVYFATPHSPWQRGSNEHLNRLARDYMPKGSDFRGLDRRKLAEIQRLLNNRPRKRLKYQTPRRNLHEILPADD